VIIIYSVACGSQTCSRETGHGIQHTVYGGKPRTRYLCESAFKTACRGAWCEILRFAQNDTCRPSAIQRDSLDDQTGTGLPVFMDVSTAEMIFVTASPSSPVAIGSRSSSTQSTKCWIGSIMNALGLPCIVSNGPV